MRSRVVRAKSDGRERRNRWAFWSATKSRRRVYMRFMIVVVAGMMAAGCAARARSVAKQQVRSETRELIEELASRFTPKHRSGENDLSMWSDPAVGGGAIFQPNPDTPEWRDFARVQAAYHRLKAKGIAAFPDLVESSDDQRYSFSLIVAAWSNHSVGDACFMIMEEEVDFRPYVYKGRTGSEGRHSGQPRYLAHVRDGEGLRRWWGHLKMHGLGESQME